MAENASFDILIDEIRPSVFSVGDDKKKKERKVRYTKSQDVISVSYTHLTLPTILRV